jgi:hypothetical protein
VPSRSDLHVAGLTIALRTADDRITWSWEGAPARFLVDPRTPDLDLVVDTFDGRSVDGTPLFDSKAVWRLLRSGSDHVIECRSELFGDAPYKRAVIDDQFTSGSVSIREDLLDLRLNPLDYPLDEVLVSNLLGRGRGVELHSCGVIDQHGRGLLFVGVSGAGKTTTARLWEGRATGVVSDDRVIVRDLDGKLWMFGTPWHGEAELSMPAGVPLEAVFLLHQAPKNALRELSEAEAVARLFACTFPQFSDPASLGFTLDFLRRIATRCRVRELQFTRDVAAVDLVLRETA